MTNEQDTTTPRIAPNRRTVLRTAAHAAWAVPAVQLATSVPAFASASKHATIDLKLTNNPGSSGTSDKTAQFDLTVANNGTATGGNASAVTLSFSGVGFKSIQAATAADGKDLKPGADSVNLGPLTRGQTTTVSVTAYLGTKSENPSRYHVGITPTATNEDGTVANSTGISVNAVFN